VFPGREHLPRSLGSVFGAAVALFLDRRVSGELHLLIRDVDSVQALALTRDGCRLYVCTKSHIAVYDTTTYTLLARACTPRQIVKVVCIAAADDGLLYVGDYTGKQVCTVAPTLDFHAVVVKPLEYILDMAVCESALFVLVMAECGMQCVVYVYDRHSGVFLRRFGKFAEALSLALCASCVSSSPLVAVLLDLDRFPYKAQDPLSAVVLYEQNGDRRHFITVKDSIRYMAFHAASQEIVLCDLDWHLSALPPCSRDLGTVGPRDLGKAVPRGGKLLGSAGHVFVFVFGCLYELT
jgi:hypothetical protein